jgi:hypothetical protein
MRLKTKMQNGNGLVQNLTKKAHETNQSANMRTEKLIKLEPKKIQKSDENLRAELTHILLTRQHNA